MGGAFALTLIMVFFWMPETAYVRTDALSIDTGFDLVRLLFIPTPASYHYLIMRL